MELPLPSQSYQTRSKPLSSQRLVNLYCEVYKDDTGALRTKSLLGTPGLVENIDFELTTPIYGADFFKNKIVFCIKNKIFYYDKNIEPKVVIQYHYEDFIQPTLFSNFTYGLMSDSKNTNNTYKLTETAQMVGGVYPDEQGITLETMPDYFIKNTELPFIAKWKFPDVIKITSLHIATRLLPQNFITACFYLDEEMSQPIGDIFNNLANDGVTSITVSGIPAEGIETDTIYLAILSMEENPNSNCKITTGSYWNWEISSTDNISGLSTYKSPIINFNDRLFLAGTSGATMSYYDSTNNGLTWNYKTIGSDLPSTQTSSMTCSNEMVIYVGNSKQEYYTTTDGVTWTKRNSFPASITLNDITFSNYYIGKIFYVEGYFLVECYANSGSTYYTSVLYSTDGINWTTSSQYYKQNNNRIKIKDYCYESTNNVYYWIYENSLTGFIRGAYYPYELTENNGKNIGVSSPTCIIPIGNNGMMFLVGSTQGTKIVRGDLYDFYDLESIDNYNINSIDYVGNACCVASGSDGIIVYEITFSDVTSNRKYQDSYNLGLIRFGYDDFYIFNNSTRVYFTQILHYNNIPYIKLEGLHVDGKVRGEPFYQYTKRYNELGKFLDLSGYVDMVDDGDHLFVLHTDGTGYYVEENSDGQLEFKQVQNDQDAGYEYQKLKSICYLAGRFIGVDYSSGTIRWTEVLNPNGWSTLNYIQSETSINELTAIRSNTREAWVFSPKNIEVYTPTGSSDSPSAFARVSGAYIDKGCKYKNCIAINENHFYWVATDGCIYRSNGYSPEKISTVALENEIMNYGEQDDILGQIYSQAGHIFYVVKFKTAKKTWCYDISTGLWHERESNDSEWIGDLIFSAWNHTFVTDKDKSILYDLDLDVGTDNGNIIKREFVFPTIKNEELRTFHRRLEIDMDTGFSNGESLFLQYSDDGGYTWSNEYWVNLGEKAEYARKLEWRRLGSAITRIYRVRMSTKNRVNIIGAYIDLKKGTV